MTARFFGLDAPRTALFSAIITGMRVFVRGSDLARSLAHSVAVVCLRTGRARQLAYYDDRMLNDIGLRRDEFPSLARERLRDQVIRFHV